MSHFIIKTSRDRVPGLRYGIADYYRIGVLEMEEGTTVAKMISPRARGVVRVVETWDALYRGKTDRCAYARAMKEAQSLCDRLNGQS